jgi:ferredoxin
MAIKVDTMRCPQNHRCPAVSICPSKALSQQGLRAPDVDVNKCTECRECTFFCPRGAFVVVD